MIVATIILDPNDCYIGDRGLPERPSFDKTLLTAICTGHDISKEAYDMLPPSIRGVTTFGANKVPITIKEIDKNAELLLVVRSAEKVEKGKQFRLDNFSLIVDTKQLQIYRRT